MNFKEYFFDNAVDLFCVGELSGFLRDLNTSWQRALGWSLEEMTSRPFIEFVYPDDLVKTITEFEEILALTAYALQEEIKRSLEAGCDDHLSKPVKKKELINKIGTILSE